MSSYEFPSDATRTLAREAPRPVRVKICGLTNLEDAQAAVEAGADLLGFIFYEKSPRYVTPAQVHEIVTHLQFSIDQPPVTGHRSPFTVHRAPTTAHRSPLTDHLPARPLYVGVFVNWPAQRVVATLDSCGLDLAQLHGEEGVAVLEALRGRAFKALRPQLANEAEREASVYGPLGPREGPSLLIDAFHAGLRGGSGTTGDWQLATRLAPRYRLLLAGGLDPDNVAAAVDQVRPWGVDVASGVEAAPGRKDHARVRAFVARAKGVATGGS